MDLPLLMDHKEKLYREFDVDGIVEWGLPLVQLHEPGMLPRGPIVVPAGVTVQVGGWVAGGWVACMRAAHGCKAPHHPAHHDHFPGHSGRCGQTRSRRSRRQRSPPLLLRLRPAGVAGRPLMGGMHRRRQRR